MSPLEPAPCKSPIPRNRAIALGAVLLLAAGLYLWNIDFPLGYHHDELKKVDFVQSNTQDFRHPLLLLQVPRALNLVLQLNDPQDVAVLGRVLSASYALLCVVLFFMGIRRLLPSPYDLLATLTFAESPILVVHAHYFKEDVLLTALCLAAVLSLCRCLEQPSRRNLLLLALVTGLAVSTKYKAFLLLPVYAIVAVRALPSLPRERRRALAGDVLLGTGLAAAVFLLVNYPLLADFQQFQAGYRGTIEEITDGHTVRIYPAAHWFSYHLVNSVIPGLTGAVTALALGSLVYFAIRRQLAWRERVLVLYLLVFHVAIELSPSKPPPGFIRYVLPEIPVLIYFAFKALAAIEAASFRAAPLLARGLAVVAIAVPLQSAVRLDYHLDARDTREQVRTYLAEQAKQTVFERYATAIMDVRSVTEVALDSARSRGIRFLAASSFQYDRYVAGGRLARQDAEVYAISCAYQALFAYPYTELPPRYRSFAFSNPTIRVIDIQLPRPADGPACVRYPAIPSAESGREGR